MVSNDETGPRFLRALAKLWPEGRVDDQLRSATAPMEDLFGHRLRVSVAVLAVSPERAPDSWLTSSGFSTTCALAKAVSNG